jgi:hypothetical protein
MKFEIHFEFREFEKISGFEFLGCYNLSAQYKPTIIKCSKIAYKIGYA